MDMQDTNIEAGDNRSSRTNRKRRWLLLGLAAFVGLALPILALTSLDEPVNLSKRAELGLKSAYPDLGASADGEYVAVVWSQGNNPQVLTKEYGPIKLKSAYADIGWEAQVDVHLPNPSVWGAQPRLAFDPDHSNQIAITWVQCFDQVEECNTIMATRCDLEGFPDTCQTPEVVYHNQPDTLSAPDIAIDDDGRMHVVWKNNSAGQIQYARYAGDSWSNSPPQTVLSDGGGYVYYDPTMAWSSGGGGRLHLAYFRYNDTVDLRRVQYRADTNLDNDSWDDVGTEASWKAPLAYEFTGSVDEPTIKPAVVAEGQEVYLAWDVHKSGSTEKYHLAYEHSSDNGLNWIDSGGTGNGIPGPGFLDASAYNSPLFGIEEEAALRPSLAISGTAPIVAWHFRGIVGEHPVYLIGVRDSRNNAGSINWRDAITITQNLNYDDDAAPDDSTNPSLGVWPGGHLNIAHMGLWGAVSALDSDWDIYYRGFVLTDTSTFPGPGTPTATSAPGSDPSGKNTPTPTPYPPGYKPKNPTPTYTPTPKRTPGPTSPYDDVRHIDLPIVLKSK